MKFQIASRDLFLDKVEAHQVAEALPDAFQFQLENGFVFRQAARLDAVGSIGQMADPRADIAFVHTVIGSANTAAAFMAHDHDSADIQNLDRIFECGSCARCRTFAGGGRDQIGNIANHEHLAWIGVENVGRIDPRVGAGYQHDTR